MPAPGFTRRYDGPDWKVFANEAELPGAAYFGIIESPEHRPNENRIALWVRDATEVDRITSVIVAADGRDISGPKRMRYGPDYYAVVFCDATASRSTTDWRAERRLRPRASIRYWRTSSCDSQRLDASAP